MKALKLNKLDRIEILTLEDNYIDIVAGGNSSVIKRATSLRGGRRMPVLAEHGFAALIKTTSHNKVTTMLFDFGFSRDVAVRNAEALGADLGEVEAAALSHGHIDHQGGLTEVAGRIGKTGLEFVMHPVAFRQNRYRTSSTGERVPIPSLKKEEVRKAGFRIVETKDPYLMLSGNVLFLGEIPRRSGFEKGMPNTYYEENGQQIKDNIEDDTSIVMDLRGKGLVVLSGCAHAGIINTVEYAREVTGIRDVHVVMGGFHLSGPAFESIIAVTVDRLKEFDPDYIVPTHCTGRKALLAFENIFPGKFILNMSGTRLTFAA